MDRHKYVKKSAHICNNLWNTSEYVCSIMADKETKMIMISRY